MSQWLEKGLEILDALKCHFCQYKVTNRLNNQDTD